MPAGSILVADDDAAIRTVLNQALSRAGYEVRSTGNAATLWRWVSQGEGDLVITDVVMPDENAFDLLPRIKKLRPELPVVVMSAQNTFMTAIRASERGAYEYLPKPFDLKELISIVGRALAEPKERSRTPPRSDEIDGIPLVGRSPAMQEIYRLLARLMQTDLTVMISGESAPSPVRTRVHPAASSRPRAAPCSSTRSATCRWRHRLGSCACCSRASTRPSAAARRSRPTCASSPPPIRTCAC
jgi:two-component system nitrogen regulation response regulator GlnG